MTGLQLLNRLRETGANLPSIMITGNSDVSIAVQAMKAGAADFIEIMEQTRRARLRQGALSWGLFRDPAVPGRYLEYFLDETWVEHLRRLERFTASDVGLRERRLAFHLGGEPPRVQRFIGESIV